MITGLDLVEWQFRVAFGEKLPLTQDQIKLHGHAVEVRLYAEDPEKNFLPSTGMLYGLRFPQGEGLRVDSGVEEGGEVTPYYDPLIAKLITHAPTRNETFDRLIAALDETLIVGPRSNVAFLRTLADLKAVRDGKVDTGLIEREAAALGTFPRPTDFAAAAKAIESLVARDQRRLRIRAQKRSNEKLSPWGAYDAFDFNGARETSYVFRIEGHRVTARVRFDASGAHASVDGQHAADCIVIEAGNNAIAWRNGRQTVVIPEDAIIVDVERIDAGGVIFAPMHGKVLSIDVQKGDRVEKGQRLAVIEAMKMEHALISPSSGTVVEITVAAGDQVAERAKVLVVSADTVENEKRNKIHENG
jgi:3-methylcrotonyl-CoA carboxylase alpha subunit